MYDLGIIGGGPAGYTAAEHAAAGGLRVVIFEKKEWGGVCLNEGCIPTKTLLYSAKLLENAKNASKYGVTIENAGFDFGKIIARKNKIVRKLNAGIRARLTHDNILLVTGTAHIDKREDACIDIRCNEEVYQIKKLLICTGSENSYPPIPGITPETVWSSREALASKELPKSIAIIGGGVIGIEFAGFFHSMGVEVSVIEMQDEIIKTMDGEIAAMLRENYIRKGVHFYLESKVLELNGNQLVFEHKGEKQTIETEKVLLSVGRKPNTHGFGLENLHPDLFRGGIYVNEYMQTSVRNVYAVGDVTGSWLLAHCAVREAEVAVNHILGKADSMSYKAIPGIVYTYPEVAGVGQTEEMLQEKGISYKVSKLPMTFSGRFVAENEGENGLCKILSDADGVILGIHMIGNPASEIIVTATLAMEQNLTLDAWQKSMFPHPTVSEILKEALFV